MRICCLLLASLLAATSFSSCASKSKVDRNRDWSALVGSYSFADARAELGEPHVIGETPAGRYAEWITRRSPQLSFGVGVGAGSVGSRSGVGIGAGTSVSPPPRGEYLHLDFGTNGLLTGWAKINH